MRGATSSNSLVVKYLQISTHTPHAGRDFTGLENDIGYYAFLLTRPMRGATSSGKIDADLVGHFYSHAPCGARRGI